MTAGTLSAHLRTEWFLAVSAATSLAFVVSGGLLLGRLSDPLWLAFIFTWLFATILGSPLSVVRHAESLAVRLGEPVGTLILTLSITFIEVVSISAVMMHGERNPTLARDTLLAVVMIILNGMVGLSLLLGALRHREQLYNLQGANAYLGVIMPLAVLSLVLPSYSRTTPDPTLSPAEQAFLVPAAVGLYAVFLAIQTGRHRTYFAGAHEAPTGHSAPHSPRYGALPHAALLVLYLAPATSVVTFASGRTNVFQGAVHLILFAAYLLFIAQG